MRRELRKAGFRAQALVRDIELEILEWLGAGGTILAPSVIPPNLDQPGTPIGTTGSVFELSRTPLQLVWRTRNDSFARYVVHCCARYHDVVSFSKSRLDAIAAISDW